jgi:hypothetical protein
MCGGQPSYFLIYPLRKEKGNRFQGNMAKGNMERLGYHVVLGFV